MLFDRVKCTIAGTDNAAGVRSILLGAAVSGFRTFAQAGVPDGAAVSYVIEDGNAFEVGKAVYQTSGNQLVRQAVTSNSNDTFDFINVSAAAVVFVTASAADLTVRTRDVGDVKMTASSLTPDGWHDCDGSAVSRAGYPTLFAAIGTAFGAGDGSTTFNLPDLNGRFVRGGVPGVSGGQEEVVLSADQAPPVRVVADNDSDSSYSSPSAGACLGSVIESGGGAAQSIYVPEGYASQLDPVYLGNQSPTPVPTVPPYLALRHIIALTAG